MEKVHLVDGTFELFRAYFSYPKVTFAEREVGAVLGLMSNTLRLCRSPDVTHIAVAFDHVIESFRNQLFSGYKTGEGFEPDLFQQFHLAEQAICALGIVVWPMTEFEADDAIATAAARFARDDNISKVIICSPDKDFAQLISSRIVMWDRIRSKIIDVDGVKEKFGIEPASIPDWLALVGDTSDGIPGLPRFGAKTAASILSAYGHLEKIPKKSSLWSVDIRGKAGLCETLCERWDDVLLYRKLATLRYDVPLGETIDDLRWSGVNWKLIEDLRKVLPLEAIERMARD